MSQYIDVTSALTDAPDSAKITFCTLSAQQISPLYRMLGDAETQEWFDWLIDLCWQAASGDSIENECIEALEALEDSPELNAEDSDRQEFYAGQALALAANTLAAYMNPSADKAKLAGQTVETLSSEFDWVLAGSIPVIRKAGDSLPDPGPLHASALDVQRSALRALEASNTTGNLASVRQSAEQFSTQLQDIVRRLAPELGWEINASS